MKIGSLDNNKPVAPAGTASTSSTASGKAGSKRPPEAFDTWLFVKGGQQGDYYRDPNMLPDLDALQANVKLQHELGFIKAPLDIRKYADLSMVQEAAKRLK